MKLKNRMSFTKNQLKKDITLIRNILKTNGYYFAEIITSIDENKELNSVKVNLEIKQGERARIKKITFIRLRFFLFLPKKELSTLFLKPFLKDFSAAIQ